VNKYDPGGLWEEQPQRGPEGNHSESCGSAWISDASVSGPCETPCDSGYVFALTAGAQIPMPKPCNIMSGAAIVPVLAKVCKGDNGMGKSGTFYLCLHQSGNDWNQFKSDLKDLAKALANDPDCEKFLTSGGTSLSTVFSDLSKPQQIFTLAALINTHLAGTTNDDVPGATPIILASGLFENSAAFEGDLTILHELGHLFKVIAPDSGDSSPGDKQVIANCGKALGIK